MLGFLPLALVFRSSPPGRGPSAGVTESLVRLYRLELGHTTATLTDSTASNDSTDTGPNSTDTLFDAANPREEPSGGEV